MCLVGVLRIDEVAADELVEVLAGPPFVHGELVMSAIAWWARVTRPNVSPSRSPLVDWPARAAQPLGARAAANTNPAPPPRGDR